MPTRRLFAHYRRTTKVLSPSAKTVVVMRGLPGAGKSTLARRLLAAARDAGRAAALCSADAYFESGAGATGAARRALKGLSKDDVYRATFDPDRLADAHASCRATFDDALEQLVEPRASSDNGGDGGGVIIVDNTHSTKREYAYYIRAARARAAAVVVVEVLSPYAPEAPPRSTHGVPVVAIARMAARWEEDDDAVRLRPWRGDEAASDERSQGGSGCNDALAPRLGAVAPTLARWLEAQRGSAHYDKRRPRTHLVMEAAGASASFL